MTGAAVPGARLFPARIIGLGHPARLTKRMIEYTLTLMTPAPQERLSPRLLSTADERREEVLRAAMKVMGARGLYGTPILDIAHAAGISQAYVFRLFPTKLSLFVAVVERSFQVIHDDLERAGRAARAAGQPAIPAMAAAYTALLGDPGILLVQLQAQAAATEPEVRDALRRGFADLLDMAERGSGASPQDIQRFFARGMLCNVSAAMEIYGLDEHWARVLVSADAGNSTA
jgi:AcrR family transcriptional regulator